MHGQPKPKRFDRNLIVIGAGSAGLVTAYIAAAVKAKVTLIEKHKMGGDCLNTGCVPSKALIKSAKVIFAARHAENLGLHNTTIDFDFAQIMARVQNVIETIAPHDSVARYRGLGVECIIGEARLSSPYHVEVDGRILSAKNIVIATGAKPFVPAIPGLDEVDYLTSDTLWQLQTLPARLIVLGGGPIGSELAQAFARLGSQVTQVEMLPRLLMREDPEVSELVMNAFRSEGIDLKTNYRATRVRQVDGVKILSCEPVDGHDGGAIEIEFDALLVAVGRAANTTGFGLEEQGIELNPNGTIKTNAYLQTSQRNIYACGDVAGPYQFTHTASHQAWYTAVNSLFGGLKKFAADYSVIPWCTFTDPEIARVGLSETEAKERNIKYEVTNYDFDGLDRAIADGVARGFVKILTPPGKDKILGVTICGEHAGDLIAEFVLAMKNKIGLNKILGTIHIYPTLAEANKNAAGNWRRRQTTERTFRWLERFHRWQRG